MKRCLIEQKNQERRLTRFCATAGEPAAGHRSPVTQINPLYTITACYVHVDYTYVHLVVRLGYPLRTSAPKPTFSHSEVITLSLIIETFLQTHQEILYSFFPQYLRDLFPQFLHLYLFNAPLLELISFIESLHLDLLYQKLDLTDPLPLLYNTPLTLTTYTLLSLSHSVVGNEYFRVYQQNKFLKILS